MPKGAPANFLLAIASRNITRFCMAEPVHSAGKTECAVCVGVGSRHGSDRILRVYGHRAVFWCAIFGVDPENGYQV